MRPVATDVARRVVCVSVFGLVTWVSWHKNGWTDRHAVWGLTHVRPRNYVLVMVKIGWLDESFRRREGVTRRRCCLLPKYLGHLLNYSAVMCIICCPLCFDFAWSMTWSKVKVKITSPSKWEIRPFSKAISSAIYSRSWQLTTDS